MFFFTADLHLDHTNIIRYCHRPFVDASGQPDVNAMNTTIVTNWNAVVTKQDVVYVLGDFCFGQPDRITHWIKQLNGNIIFIKGNHDRSLKDALKPLGKPLYDVYKFKHDKTIIWLSHYAHRVWDQSHYGAWHLYGHCHGSLLDDTKSLSFDVGVDSHGFAPLSLDKVADIMSRKTWTPPKHGDKL